MPNTQTAGGEELLTLSEVSKRTEISMPTLQRYKKLYQDRIPSVGKGRKQRYPEEALPVFKEIKEENIQKRGRPRKSAAKKATKRTPPPKKSARRGRKAPQADSGDELLTLTRVSELTGVSYPTLVRYVKLYKDEIPFEGQGRRRRYKPEAVEVFKRIRGESRRGRGRKPSAGKKTASRPRAQTGTDKAVDKRLAAIEKSQARLEKRLESLINKLSKPRKLI